jgi:RNA polymerase sigma-70 factor, ECF subfamily
MDRPSDPAPERDRSNRTATSPPAADHLRDQALADAVRAGDEASFEALFRLYSKRLFLFAERMVRSREVAEDLVADVFVRIWERRAEWELRGSMKSYLYTATRNRALTHLEQQRVWDRAHRDARAEGRPPGLGRPPPAADVALHDRELGEAIAAAIERLPERTREAFVLHRQHGLSYAEVAQTMGIAPRTVEVLIRRALKALRAHLGHLLLLLVTALP